MIQGGPKTGMCQYTVLLKDKIIIRKVFGLFSFSVLIAAYILSFNE